MSIIGIVLKKGSLEDNRKIFYLHENIRRYIQKKGFDIEIIIPNVSDIDNMIGYLSAIVYLDDNIIYNTIPSICITNIDDLSIYDEFFNNIKDRGSYLKVNKTLGVTCRYYELDNIGPVTYIAESITNIFNCNIRVIIPVQDVCYPITRTEDYPILSDEDKIKINNQINRVDGLLFPGGYKFTPFDRYILDYAVLKDIPTLGICLGMQLISCFNNEVKLLPIESSINHRQEDDNVFTHYVDIKEDNILYDIIGTNRIKVNSFHRMMATSNPNVEAVAYSEDGIIEGIIIPNKKFILGVQWHPEISYNIDIYSRKIVDYFINLL